MRLSWAKLVVGAVLTVLVVAPLTGAFAQQASDVRVDITLKDADMLTATRALTARTGIQFVMEPTIEPFGRITLQLTGVTAEMAIRYICTAAGASFRRDDSGVYIISRSKPAPAEVAAPIVKKPMVLRSFKVLKADPRDVYEAILDRNPFDNEQSIRFLSDFTECHLVWSIERWHILPGDGCIKEQSASQH
jgi:hypothetical protein